MQGAVQAMRASLSVSQLAIAQMPLLAASRKVACGRCTTRKFPVARTTITRDHSLCWAIAPPDLAAARCLGPFAHLRKLPLPSGRRVGA